MLDVFLGNLQVWMERVSQVRDPDSFSSRIASLLCLHHQIALKHTQVFFSAVCVFMEHALVLLMLKLS